MQNRLVIYLLMFATCLYINCKTRPPASQAACIERYKWQYADYTQKHFFVNQVFAKGFAVFVNIQSRRKVQPLVKDSIHQIVIDGFRTALTNWGVSLLMNKVRLSGPLKKYLDEYTMQGDGHSTYNAPQVFEVDCPENANFVVNVYIPKGRKFPANKGVLAIAELPGRAIMLNMQSQVLRYNQRFFDVMNSWQEYNLVPVLAHELGHCFGLRHTTSLPSIMAVSATELNRFPSPEDGIQFALILDSAITGNAPGYFSPAGCTGLRVK